MCYVNPFLLPKLTWKLAETHNLDCQEIIQFSMGTFFVECHNITRGFIQ